MSLILMEIKLCIKKSFSFVSYYISQEVINKTKIHIKILTLYLFLNNFIVFAEINT